MKHVFIFFAIVISLFVAGSIAFNAFFDLRENQFLYPKIDYGPDGGCSNVDVFDPFALGEWP